MVNSNSVLDDSIGSGDTSLERKIFLFLTHHGGCVLLILVPSLADFDATTVYWIYQNGRLPMTAHLGQSMAGVVLEM